MRHIPLKEIALAYQAQGLSIIPLGKNKETNLVKWKHLQEEPADKNEIAHWPWLKAKGLALITGFASGNVEVIDFDFKNGLLKEEYVLFRDTVLKKYPKLEVLIQKTPSPNKMGDTGRHWIYRCAKIGNNAKLAHNEEGEAIIETRGQGGLIYMEPTEGYEFMREGDNLIIPEIREEQRDYMMDVALSFDCTKEGKVSNPVGKDKKGKMRFERKECPSFPPSFIDYSNDHKIKELIEEDGWEFVDEGKDDKGKKVHRYSRPGVGHVSSSLYVDENTFYNFSSSVDGLPSHQMMNCAEYVMYRDFNGNEEAMLEWLVDEGYEIEEEGTDEERSPKLRLKKDIKEKRFISNLIHSIKALAELRFNEIRQVFEIRHNHKQAVYMDNWNGVDGRAIHGMLLKQGVKVPFQKVQHVLADMGNWDHIDPVKDWLNSLAWDKRPRIDDLAGYIRCKDQKRWKNNFKKHMIRCVRQLLLEGINRYALILHSGEQGNGKSTFIRYVIRCGPQKFYYSEDLPKENSEFGVARFVSMSAHGNMEELDAFKKADIDHLKSLTTREDAAMRRMRTDAMFTVPRRVNFWGSTNKAQFLTDTSNTRWIINEVEDIDWGYDCMNMTQVWAEAIALYKGGVECDLVPDEIQANEEVTEDYKSELFPSELVYEVFQPCGRRDKGVCLLSATEILDDLELYYSNKESVMRLIKNTYVNRFGSLLKGMKFTYYRGMNRGVTKRGYFVKPSLLFLDSKVFMDSNYDSLRKL